MPFQPCLLCWPILIAKHSTHRSSNFSWHWGPNRCGRCRALQSENPALKIEVIDVLGLLGASKRCHFWRCRPPSQAKCLACRQRLARALEDIQEIKDPTEADAVTLLAREIQNALKRDQLLELDSQGRVDVWAWNAAARNAV